MRPSVVSLPIRYAVLRAAYDLTRGDPRADGAPLSPLSDALGCDTTLALSLLEIAIRDGLVRVDDAGRYGVTPLGCLAVELRQD